MKDNLLIELFLSAALTALLIILFVFNTAICAHPLMETAMLTLVGILALFFISLVWKERSRDERENFHKYLASRFAYLAGVLILTIGIILQTIQNHLDIWLVVSLCTMLLLKMIGIIYGRLKH